MTEKVIRALQSCKNTLKDTIELEDYEEEGFIPLSTLKEAFVTLDINLDKELMDYILHVVYQKSESISKMNYQVLFDLIEGKLTQGHLSAASDSQSRKRPESSSPDKIKARNQQKF